MPITNHTIACLLIPATILVHLVLAPYTKVEESFNIQAIHDITTYGVPLWWDKEVITHQYDHVDFPGAVPRTFVGALFVSGLANPFLNFVQSPKQKQILVRATIGIVNAVLLIGLRNALRKVHGRSVANWYCFLQASQFHVMFYASRTLPNIFAFMLTTLALRYFVLAQASPNGTSISSKRHGVSLALLTFAGVIFRSELAVLVATQTLYALLVGKVSLTKTIIPAGLTGAIVGLLVTIPIDSLLWQKFPLWPEFTSFYYNTILGKSSDWGTSPIYFYFVNAIPRLLLNPLTYTLLIPLALFSPATRQSATAILAPELAFTALYSFLPHKEWRFILYIIPGLTVVSAQGASWVWLRRSKSFLYRIATLALVASVTLSFIASAGLLVISRLNYPGGVAMTRLHNLLQDLNNPVRVYADNLACQTGVTRFLEARTEALNGTAKFMFDKTENARRLLEPSFWLDFDYALVEHPERCIGKWEPIDVVTAYTGLKLVKPGEEIHHESPMDHVLLDDRRELWQRWNELGEVARKRVTKGWWLTINMEPRIKILRRQDVDI